MKITKANGKSEYAVVENLKKRSGETDPKIVEIVTSILKGVKEGGDEAVREYTSRFDGSVPKKIVIEKDELQSYLDVVDEEFIGAITRAKENKNRYNHNQPKKRSLKTDEKDEIMGQRKRLIKSVYMYPEALLLIPVLCL